MTELDITGWSLLSERPSTRNYTSPDRKWMLKVLRTLKEEDIETLRKEQDISSYVHSIGITTPAAGGLEESSIPSLATKAGSFPSRTG